jgi:hypothetical protein
MKMLLPAFENDELSEGEKESVILHLASCSRCLTALESIRELHNRLSLLPATSLDSEMTNNIISKIKRMQNCGDMETVADPDIIMPADFEDDPGTEASIKNEENSPGLSLDSGEELLPGWEFPE